MHLSTAPYTPLPYPIQVLGFTQSSEDYLNSLLPREEALSLPNRAMASMPSQVLSLSALKLMQPTEQIRALIKAVKVLIGNFSFNKVNTVTYPLNRLIRTFVH